ncbi:Resuscitation-promoting factor RpfA [Streptomyces sp. R302]|uniref:transglycosylase family protein n=1 Tax=unclassified Streptomyces TaxID=2593676 RepID=UPI00145D8C3E|nr:MULTISPECIES: FG-GAP-like repeat-containing protein [unclassified Streptomyces]NML50204.1 Resuscitation-promoting factor RpfA [Streptomyces sp. R301]NML79195.1 Resuscitation-promoting factor RpfA [Streptomyces sp. R302]
MSLAAAPRRSAAATLLAAVALGLLSAPSASAASVATWDKVAQCESGGNWSINTGNGYYGGLQFAKSTWDGFGGGAYASYPHQASKKEQILIAEKVLAVQGPGAWPTCGAAAGLGTDHADPYPAQPAVQRDHDFTGDGNDDLLGVSASDGKLRMYAGNGAGGFASHEVGPGWGAMDKVKAADFNNDGDADLVARASATGELHLYLGNGGGGFKSHTVIGTGWNTMEDFVAGDFTGDGKADIAAVRKDDATLRLYSGTGTDVTYTKQIGSGWSGMSKLAAGDFNGDGRADLVAQVDATANLNLYVGTSTGVAPAIQIGQNWSGIGKLTLADIDSDGRADVVATIASSGDLYHYASMSNSLKSGVKIGQGWGGMTHLA